MYLLKKLAFALCLGLLCIANPLIAQERDTVLVDPSQLNPKVLLEGTHRYLVYFRMGKEAPRTRFQLWTRILEHKTHKDKDVISVEQVWENNDTIIHTARSLNDSKTMEPYYHESWWKSRGLTVVDFVTGQFQKDGELLQKNELNPTKKNLINAFEAAQQSTVFNWHTDLEFFPLLPYELGKVFTIPFYEPGSIPPKLVHYEVIGESILPGYDGTSIHCWLLFHRDGTSESTYRISKKTKEVLKMEQLINGNM
ncbi:MAG: hypothetical protein Tsb004_28090 [Allomuricauda sp.]